jgi:GntR family transcriptional regulator
MDQTVSGALPKYVQIANTIAEWIRSGKLGAGDQLPTERRLAADLGVNRMTVRHALTVLTQQGLINSQHGVGTFVTRPMLEQPVDILVGFSDNLLKKGIRPGAQLLDLKSTSADQLLATELQIPLGAPVFAIRRLRLADNIPMALEYSYFPERILPGLDRYDLERRSIYAILAEEYGVTLAGAFQTLEPVVALAYQARLLQVSRGAPLMLVTRTSSDDRQRIVEFAKDLYRGDCFRFVSYSRSPVTSQALAPDANTFQSPLNSPPVEDQSAHAGPSGAF